MRVLKGHTGKLRAVAYSPDGSRLATAGDAGVTLVWDVASGRPVTTIAQPDSASVRRADERRVWRLAFSPDGELLATATQHVRVWRAADGAAVAFPAGLGESREPSLAFTPDGSLLVARRWSFGHEAAFTGGVAVWHRAAEGLAPFVEEGGGVLAMAVSAAGGLLAVVRSRFDAHGVSLWRLDDRKLDGLLDVPPVPMDHLRAAVNEVAFSPDGGRLAVAAGRHAYVYDVPGRKQSARLEGHASEVSSVAFAPDGTALATAGMDGAVRVWDVASGRERASYDWGLGKLRGLAFAPDGMTAAVVGDKSKVVVWDVE